MPKNLLMISDLDDTLLGDDDALCRFEAFFDSIKERVSVIYASGRFCASICQDIHATLLPQPVAIIGGVGTEIHSFPEGHLEQTWMQRISQYWSAQIVRDVLSDEEALVPQPGEFQSEFKVSYFLRDASGKQLSRLREKLIVAGIRVSLIYSSDRDLDILPAGVDKGAAAAFMADKIGFTADRVIVAGNSGNDARLFEHNFRGIIVGNAHQELKRQFADDDRVYQSPYTWADGIRDGMQHWIRELDDSQSTRSVCTRSHSDRGEKSAKNTGDA